MVDVVDVYDGPDVPELESPADDQWNPADQELRGPGDRGHAHSYGYDDRENLARASARLHGYGSAPHTAAAVRTNLHHTVPRQILRELPEERHAVLMAPAP